jgi:hypothetical protein
MNPPWQSLLVLLHIGILVCTIVLMIEPYGLNPKTLTSKTLQLYNPKTQTLHPKP